MSSHYDPRVHSQKRQTMNLCIPILLTPPQSDAIGFASSWLDQLKAWLTSPEGGIAWGLHLLGFLAVLATARIASNVLGKIARKAASTSRLAGSELLKDFFENSVRKAVMLIGFVMALGQLGVEIGPLLAGLAGASFVLGFALQESLNNFAAGIMLLLYRPYDIGDWVEVSGEKGKVKNMNLVSTILETGDKQEITIPNGSIWGNVIRNTTASKTRRVDMVFGIGYQDDMGKASEVLQSILDDHELVLDDPAPTIEVSELADSSVNFIVRPWSNRDDYWRVRWDVTRSVKERFDAEGISIPYPQHDVHLIGDLPKA